MSNLDKKNYNNQDRRPKQKLFSSKKERADNRQKLHQIRMETHDPDDLDFVSDRNGFVHHNFR